MIIYPAEEARFCRIALLGTIGNNGRHALQAPGR
jgi:hypothetical protein